MNKPAAIDVPTAAITAPLDADTARLVAQLAARRGQSPEQFAAEAIRRVAESEADFDAFIQLGIDQADRGELISQQDMEAWFEERVAGRRST